MPVLALGGLQPSVTVRSQPYLLEEEKKLLFRCLNFLHPQKSALPVDKSGPYQLFGLWPVSYTTIVRIVSNGTYFLDFSSITKPENLNQNLSEKSI